MAIVMGALSGSKDEEPPPQAAPIELPSQAASINPMPSKYTVELLATKLQAIMRMKGELASGGEKSDQAVPVISSDSKGPVEEKIIANGLPMEKMDVASPSTPVNSPFLQQGAGKIARRAKSRMPTTGTLQAPAVPQPAGVSTASSCSSFMTSDSASATSSPLEPSKEASNASIQEDSKASGEGRPQRAIKKLSRKRHGLKTSMQSSNYAPSGEFL